MDTAQHSTPLGDAEELCRLGVVELGKRFADRSVSPIDVTRAVLKRAEAINGKFNAFTRIDHEAAEASARASESRWRAGAPLSPIDGVPTTIKDIVWVKDWPTGYGSIVAGGIIAGSDSPAVSRLRGSGAVLIGLTTTPEFGWKAVTDSPATGVTLNPWNPALTPGGSSGGAAVAAATGAGVLHLGTDGGGSIRIPAAFTGIVGLKPTFGRVPAYPASAFGTVAHLGPIARTAADAFTMLAAMSGTDRLDWFQGPGTLPALERGHVDFKGMRIAYWRDPPVGHLDAEIGTALDGVLALLEKAGARIEPMTLPEPDLLSIFEVLWFSSAANRVSQFNAEQRRLIDPALMEAAALPGKWSAVDYVRATNQRTAFGLRMDDLLEKFDLLVSPATALLPFEAGEEKPQGMQRWTEWAGFSFPLNLSQQPAIVVPCGRSFGGLPIGVQFVAARGADAKVVAAAQAFEALRPASFL